MDPLPPPFAFFLLLFSGWVNRQQQAVIDYLREENRILRAAYGPQRVRLTDDQRRRLAVKGNALGRRRLADVAGIVTPDTILRWYRLLVAKKYDGSEMRRPGRPRTAPDLAALVARVANENPTWGYTRIRGALEHLGHDVARNTIKAILQNQGIEPTPERGTKTPWKTFLAAHWDGLAAADFFTVEVLTWRGLVRYVVFFVIRLKTRTVEIAGITCQPHELWMTQMVRNLTDPYDGFLRDAQYVILDRDPLYTAAFRTLLRDSGVTLVRLPARSPNLNAFAERFVGTVRTECLARVVPLGEGHLRAAIRAFVDHYHEERPTRVCATRSSRPRPRRSDKVRSGAGNGSAACSSTTPAPPRSLVWPSFRTGRGRVSPRPRLASIVRLPAVQSPRSHESQDRFASRTL
jgi:putative transposase